MMSDFCSSSLRSKAKEFERKRSKYGDKVDELAELDELIEEANENGARAQVEVERDPRSGYSGNTVQVVSEFREISDELKELIMWDEWDDRELGFADPRGIFKLKVTLVHRL